MPAFLYTGDVRLCIFHPEKKKFEKLLEELLKAEKYIFLEYFIVEQGRMWDAILEILINKAHAGVDVRLIYDDFGCFFLLPKNFAKRLEADGIRCRVFNPFLPVFSSLQNNRDHRKIVAIDGRVAFTGGINIADEYINALEKHGHWKDAAVFVSGAAARSFTLMFLEMWSALTGARENLADFCPALLDSALTCEFVQPYAASPLDGEYIAAGGISSAALCGAALYLYLHTISDFGRADAWRNDCRCSGRRRCSDFDALYRGQMVCAHDDALLLSGTACGRCANL